MYSISVMGEKSIIDDKYLREADGYLEKYILEANDNLQIGSDLLKSVDKELNGIFSKKIITKSEYNILKMEFDKRYKLSKEEYALAAMVGVISSIIQIFMVGIPQRTSTGTKAAPLSNYVRESFEKKYSTKKIKELEQSVVSKVPFDAQTNIYKGENITQTYVEGLNPYYHRLYSLGHDPLLGFIVGVFDIMNGSMTTIDKTGKIVIQQIEKYANRKESDLFAAIAKEFIHLKTDVTTTMGLPAPFMGVANMLQFGSFGENDDTIAQIVQGMYYEGYDFIHFVSTTIPSMIIEVIVRLYFVCSRIKRGIEIKDAVQVKHDKIDYKKMEMVIFISHSILTAVNAGQLLFTKNPLSINYNEWMVFARYICKQIVWQIIEKPKLTREFIIEKADVLEMNVLDYWILDNTKEKYIVLEV